MTLVEFIRHWLDVEQEVAEAGSPAINSADPNRDWLLALREESWHKAQCAVATETRIDLPCDCGVPSRVLAEIAAKRAILDQYEAAQITLHETPEGWDERSCTAYRMAIRFCVETLAQPFKGRDGWQDEWEVAQ